MKEKEAKKEEFSECCNHPILYTKIMKMAWCDGCQSYCDVAQPENSELKNACGYGSGSTAIAIVKELGLLTEGGKLSNRGKEYLYFAFDNGSNV